MKTLSYNHRIGLIVIISTALILAALCLAPIPQDPAYHGFSDRRMWFSISNFGNVASNLPFIIVGIWGVVAAWNRKIILTGYVLWGVFFLGVFLTGFGSAYYHLVPNNETLVWDRLPMTISFMSLFSLIIMERIHHKIGLFLSPVLLAAGISAVWYWRCTEALGHGDLRLYALIQFLPIAVIPLIIILFPAKHDGNKYLIYTLVWYVLAKLFEHFDGIVFDFTGGVISGHSLKHIAAAIGTGCMIGYMKSLPVYKRQI